MINKKTVFVLGAGASKEADLPVGDELKKIIARLLDIKFAHFSDQTSGDREIMQIFWDAQNNGVVQNANDLIHKAWTIRDQMPAAPSIDNFLHTNKNDEWIVQVGKMAIAKSIVVAESKSKLSSTSDGYNRFDPARLEGTWYMQLWQMLVEGVDPDTIDQTFNNISFIVFNYDRCIERFLLQMTESYFGLTRDRAQALVQAIEIVHPYGSVGSLTARPGEGLLPYGSPMALVREASGRINTFTEGLQDKEIRTSIEKVLAHAEQVVFLGFAFHPINMQLLNVQEGDRVVSCKIYATVLEMSAYNVESIETQLIPTLGMGRVESLLPSYRPLMLGMNCSNLLKTLSRVLTA